MLRWKLYAFAVLALSVWSIGRRLFGVEHWAPDDWIGVPITFVGLIGLLAYAFSFRVLREGFWRVFHMIFLGWMSYALKPLLFGNAPIGIKAIAVAAVLAFLGFNWLALYRLAGSPWDLRTKAG